jgi:hypothetical protein
VSALTVDVAVCADTNPGGLGALRFVSAVIGGVPVCADTNRELTQTLADRIGASGGAEGPVGAREMAGGVARATLMVVRRRLMTAERRAGRPFARR